MLAGDQESIYKNVHSYATTTSRTYIMDQRAKLSSVKERLNVRKPLQQRLQCQCCSRSTPVDVTADSHSISNILTVDTKAACLHQAADQKRTVIPGASQYKHFGFPTPTSNQRQNENSVPLANFSNTLPYRANSNAIRARSLNARVRAISLDTSIMLALNTRPVLRICRPSVPKLVLQPCDPLPPTDDTKLWSEVRLSVITRSDIQVSKPIIPNHSATILGQKKFESECGDSEVDFGNDNILTGTAAVEDEYSHLKIDLTVTALYSCKPTTAYAECLAQKMPETSRKINRGTLPVIGFEMVLLKLTQIAWPLPW